MEDIHVFSIDTLDIPINRQDQNNHHRFCSGQGNDKKRKALSPNAARIKEMVKGHQSDIGRIKHELNGHQHTQNIAAELRKYR